MEQKELDQLYHLLRRASNIPDEPGKAARDRTALTGQERVNVIYGLCRHLLAGGDYLALIKYSMMYGELFLVEPTFRAIQKHGWKPERVVELGSGLSWLGRGLAARLGLLPTVFVDKRPWPIIDLILDLEIAEDRAEILRQLHSGDLVVACDLLHCLEDPHKVVADFVKWPMAILEFMPEDDNLRHSYSVQIHRHGASPLYSLDGLVGIFTGRKTTTVDLDPYILLLVEPGTQETHGTAR